jgi:hypothetical protein
MQQDSFELECDRLSHVVDPKQFERLRWSRVEGPMLARLVELAQGAMESRPDFELIDEGSTGDIKRFVLKVHGNRIAAIGFYLQGGQAVARIDAIDRGRCSVLEGSPIGASFDAVNEQWMAAVLRELLSRLQAIPQG